jgi:hypothetical protein
MAAMSPAGGNGGGGATDMLPPVTNGILGKPSSWWVVFLVIFVAFVWIARRYGGGEKERFGNLLPSFYNGVFLTVYIVLILNVLKVFATKFKIPGVSELILAA